jgi:GTP:adenosylcobinamide-phosphate guanylyltransferase
MVDVLKIFNVGDKIRVGNVNDGGYVIPKIVLEDSKSLFSYGINDDIGFDEHYIKLTNKKVYGYDHTIDGISTQYPDNFTLYYEGLSSKKTDKTDNFLNHYKNLNINDRVLLKIDVEGCEYEYFEGTDIFEISKITNCVVIEFHSLNKPEIWNRFLNIIKNLNEYYKICHIHGNNWSPIFNFNYNEEIFDFPEVIEITFINKDMVKFCEVDLNYYPTEFDNPNKFNEQELNYDIFNLNNFNDIKNYEDIKIHTYKDLDNFKQNDNDNIPKLIFRTGKYKLSELPHEVRRSYQIELMCNPEYKLFYFDDDDCLKFIEDFGDSDLIESYKLLIPTAFKADLWRYLILYVYGGIYLDFTHKPIVDYNYIIKDKKDIFVKDIVENEHMFSGIYNAFMCSTPKNTIFKNALSISVDVIKNKKKYRHPLDYTGCMILHKSYELERNLNDLEYQYIHFHSDNTGIVVDIKTDKKIINCRSKNHYSILYNDNKSTHYRNLVIENLLYKDDRWDTIDQIYLETLKRKGDLEGLVYHYLSRKSYNDIKRRLYKSDEFRNFPEFKNRVKKLDVILISVNYNDFLSITLKENKKLFDNIHVITSSKDSLCQQICKSYGVNCVITDVMYDDSIFNKGKAYNYLLNRIENIDYVLILDADIIVLDKIDINQLDERCFYYEARRLCESYEDYMSMSSIEDLEYDSPHGDGFFQLVNMKNEIIYFSEDFKNCNNVDVDYREKFESRILLENQVIHLGEKETNWDGRITKPFITREEIDKLIKK